MSLHISDQLGTENACQTLLCWLIVMIWVLGRNDMYMNVILDLSTAIQQF